ncbi:MAG TPA: HIT domain-containing protein [Acidobacteriota bacterium]|nr:HIT domain-containing protein [Acidobacteriota bacterium]
MENLWTPWRFHYLKQAAEQDDCVFCRLISDPPEKDRENLVVYRGRRVFVVLNRFPYTSGHLLIVTRRHIANLVEAEDEELSETILEARRWQKILTEVYSPDGFNIGFNLGRCAGAGVAGHLHLHVVPRWSGDSNFVAVIGQTRVIPELLETTYEKLSSAVHNR